MFLDIRDFTAFAEKRSAADVVAYLNTIFGEAVDAVVQHHGIVNKFLGDGFMAVFGAPVADGNPCARGDRAPGSSSSRASSGWLARAASRPRASASACTRAPPSWATSARRTARSTRSSATW